MSRSSIIAKCHCGAVEFELPRRPTVITRCNCSYCRQIDPFFAYYKRRTIRFRSSARHLESYTWGRGVLQWFRCRHCGAFTHHVPVGYPGPEARLGVNLRLVRAEVLPGTTVKLRDGAENTWKVIREYVL